MEDEEREEQSNIIVKVSHDFPDTRERNISLNSSDKDVHEIVEKKPVRRRAYYADWMRATAVHLVICVHSMWNAREAVNLEGNTTLTYKDEID